MFINEYVLNKYICNMFIKIKNRVLFICKNIVDAILEHVFLFSIIMSRCVYVVVHECILIYLFISLQRYLSIGHYFKYMTNFIMHGSLGSLTKLCYQIVLQNGGDL